MVETIKIYQKGEEKLVSLDSIVDPAIKPELDGVKRKVLRNDRDWVCVVDGEEGVGKSVFAMQICKYLDPTFNIDDVVFNGDDFIKRIKDPNIPKGKAILLDEAYNTASSRGSMSEVNKSLVGVATEMRQKNLFIVIILPSFFDLDRYFALWRCRALFHLYFNEDESERRFIIFPKEHKKYLYLYGKKTYSYKKPRSPFPPVRTKNFYVIPEDTYREKKSKAFNTRAVSQTAKRWMEQRDAYAKHLVKHFHLTLQEVGDLPEKYGAKKLSAMQISTISKEIMNLEGT